MKKAARMRLFFSPAFALHQRRRMPFRATLPPRYVSGALGLVNALIADRQLLHERLLETGDAVEHRLSDDVILAIGDEVAVALELEALVGQRAA